MDAARRSAVERPELTRFSVLSETKCASYFRASFRALVRVSISFCARETK